MKNLYLIIGPSGSGKTTLARELEQAFDGKQVQSYTTRPPRFTKEEGHIFVTEQEMAQLCNSDMVAYTKFAGYEYGVTKSQLDKCAFYVIDIHGAVMLADNYKREGGNVFVIWLDAGPCACRERMLKDGRSDVDNRIIFDEKAFNQSQFMTLLMAYGFNAVFCVDAERSKDDIFMEVYTLINKLED